MNWQRVPSRCSMTFHYRAASRLVRPPTGGHPGCFQGGCYEGCCKRSRAGFRVNASEPLRQRHRSASAGSHGKSTASSGETRRLPHVAALRLFPPATEGPFLLLTSSPALGVVSILDLSLSNRCVVVSCCCLNRVLADQGRGASSRVRICQASSPVFVPIPHPFLVRVVFCRAVGVVNTPETSPSLAVGLTDTLLVCAWSFLSTVRSFASVTCSVLFHIRILRILLDLY